MKAKEFIPASKPSLLLPAHMATDSQQTMSNCVQQQGNEGCTDSTNITFEPDKSQIIWKEALQFVSWVPSGWATVKCEPHKQTCQRNGVFHLPVHPNRCTTDSVQMSLQVSGQCTLGNR